MSKAAMNLQDSFLNQVRRENSEVRVLLVNGTLLRGVVKGFDNFTLILNNRNGQHLVYKHAIAQIVSHRSHVKTEEQPAHDTSSEGAQPSAETGGEAKSESTRGQGDRPPRREGGRDRGEGREGKGKSDAKSKKEGFNTLDLSGVKLGDKS